MKAFIGIMIMIALLASAAHAATLYVGPGETYTTIQSAIDASSNGDVIIVRDATYTGAGNRDIDFKGKAIHLKSENGAESCTIDAGGSASEPHRCFVFQSGEAEDSVLEGFTITGGFAGGPYPITHGGGIFCSCSFPTIINNVISGNTASMYGGGIYCGTSSPTVVNNTLANNTAHSGGGGMFVSLGTPFIAENVFVGNKASGAPSTYGGAIYCSGSRAMIVRNSIEGNTASHLLVGQSAFEASGGGVFVDGYATLEDNRIAGNTATGVGGGSAGYGGGVFLYGSPTVCKNIIVGNTANGGYGGYGPAYGGGLCVGRLGVPGAGARPIIANNVIAGNAANGTSAGACGGGLYCHSSPSITGNVLSNNNASSYGGGICSDSDASPSISNNCISGNSTIYGGGIYVAGSSHPLIANNTIADNRAESFGGGLCWYSDYGEISNSIFLDNTATRGPAIALRDSSTLLVSYTNVAEGWTSIHVEPDCTLIEGPGNIDPDPLFADPANGDYHLKSRYGRWSPSSNGGAGAWVIDDVTSPCIDTGNPATAYANEPQPNGCRVNMGAYGNTGEASKSPCLLAVHSTPITGITITGNKPGTTNYTITCVDEGTVDFSAPSQVSSGGRRYNFVRWLINGVEQPAGQADLHLIVAADSTVVAAYEVQHYNLNVRSAPVNGFSISGDKPGITEYSVTCDDGQTVNLSALATATLAGQRYDFLHWTVDGVDGPSGQTGVAVVMDVNHTATAVYRMPRKLTVLSAPVLPLSVTGLKPGATNYVADCDDQQAVYLTAPSSVTVGSKAYRFVRWFIDNEPQLMGQRDILVVMDGDHTALAQYEWRLPGDANSDCIVNVLDLIYVRNRMGTWCSE